MFWLVFSSFLPLTAMVCALLTSLLDIVLNVALMLCVETGFSIATTGELCLCVTLLMTQLTLKGYLLVLHHYLHSSFFAVYVRLYEISTLINDVDSNLLRLLSVILIKAFMLLFVCWN
jgi:hypothetical protein